MPIPLRAKWRVEALHARLRERLADLDPLVVEDVTRVFLEVSSFECEHPLHSLSFEFDEDDGRVARLEAQFADWDARDPSRALRGYEVHVTLPRLLPPCTSETAVRTASDDDRDLPARFVRAIADMGAYRTIASLEATAVDVYLL